MLTVKFYNGRKLVYTVVTNNFNSAIQLIDSI